MSNAASRLGSGLVFLLIALSIPIGLYAFGFQARLSGNPEFHARFDSMPVYAFMHVVGSGVALLIGGFQFSSQLRRRYLGAHRWVGRAYLLAVLMGGIGGFALAGVATGGLVARCGFGLLAILWLYSGWQAYAAVRARDLVNHRLWMARNFALTFAAVTLRIYLGLLGGALGYSFDEAYPLVAWLAWVPNLVLVEWLLPVWDRRRRTAS
ncbi:MAG: DUF2306 domain-containing protein [Pseudomonadales bacterium]